MGHFDGWLNVDEVNPGFFPRVWVDTYKMLIDWGDQHRYFDVHHGAVCFVSIIMGDSRRIME